MPQEVVTIKKNHTQVDCVFVLFPYVLPITDLK